MKISNDYGTGAGKNVRSTDNATDQKSIEKSISSRNQGAQISGQDSVKVNLSNRAQDIAKIKELAAPKDEINTEKVARLQKLIDEGKYKVDAEAVADRLVDQQLMFPS